MNSPIKKTAADILTQGAFHIRERAASRDTPTGERSMARATSAFNSLEGTTLTEAQGWRFMAVLKLARATAGSYNIDDYEDGAAYMALAAECLEATKPFRPITTDFNCGTNELTAKGFKVSIDPAAEGHDANAKAFINSAREAAEQYRNGSGVRPQELVTPEAAVAMMEAFNKSYELLTKLQPAFIYAGPDNFVYARKPEREDYTSPQAYEEDLQAWAEGHTVGKKVEAPCQCPACEVIPHSHGSTNHSDACKCEDCNGSLTITIAGAPTHPRSKVMDHATDCGCTLCQGPNYG